MQRLRITFLLPSRGAAGGHHAIMRFANGLLDRGHQVRIFCKERPAGPKAVLRRLFLDVRYRAAARKDWVRRFRGETLPYHVLRADDFAAGEIVIAVTSESAVEAGVLPEGRVRKVLFCHGLEPGNWKRMVASWRLPCAKIAVSSHIVPVMERETGEQVLGVVPDGVDCMEYCDASGGSDRTGVGSVYHWGAWKEPETTVKALLEAKTLLGPKARIRMFGHGRRPPGFKRCEYTRLPSQSRAREIYSGCRVWLLASRLEGFGMPVLEAMACGCAVVSTACGGPQDVIRDGVNGFLVPPGDVDAMVDRVVRLFTDDQLRQGILEESRRTASEFTWDRSVRMLEESLMRIGAGRCDEAGGCLATGRDLS